jgi:uncharacterized RDD family membrane protein YckC
MNDSVSDLPPAPLWRRYAAIGYDTVVVLAIWMVVGFAVLWVFGIEGNVNADDDGMPYLSPVYSYTVFLTMILSAWLFFAWFWTHSGQTIGMQAWKIKIQNQDGSNVNYLQSLKRFAFAFLSLIPAGIVAYWLIRMDLSALGILIFIALDFGHWWALFNTDRKSLHDRISESVVVRVSR